MTMRDLQKKFPRAGGVDFVNSSQAKNKISHEGWKWIVQKPDKTWVAADSVSSFFTGRGLPQDFYDANVSFFKATSPFMFEASGADQVVDPRDISNFLERKKK
jgi:hypothetical protein